MRNRACKTQHRLDCNTGGKKRNHLSRFTSLCCNKQFNLSSVTYVLVVSLILIYLVVPSHALGIGPANSKINFKPDQIIQSSFTVFRESPQPKDIKITVVGELADYVVLPKTKFTLNGDTTRIPFSISFPSQLDPGSHFGKIVIEEVSTSGGIGAILKLPHKLLVDVPYPDKYLDAQAKVEEFSKEIKFTTVATNKGSVAIESAKAFYDIYEKESSESERAVFTVSTESLSVDPQKYGLLEALVSKERLVPGSYIADITVDYDDSLVNIEHPFLIGEPSIILRQFDQYFLRAEINELNLEIFNDWNERLKGLFIEVLIKTSEGNEYLKTFTFDIEPYEKKIVNTFWDTRDLPLGKYDAAITIHNGKQTVKRDVTFEVLERDDYDTKFRRIDSATQEDSQNLVLAMFSILVLVVVMTFGMMIFVFMRMGKKET